MRPMPHTRRGRGEQDRPQSSRTIRAQDWSGRRVLLYRRKQTKGRYVEGGYTGRSFKGGEREYSTDVLSLNT